jgi:hypothetical protein
MGTPRMVDPLRAEWVALYFVVMVLALAWIHAISPRKWRLITHATMRLRLGRQTMREELDLQDRTLIALLVMAASLIGLFAYQSGIVVGAFEGGWLRAFELMLIVLLVVAVQLALLRLAGFLFRADGGAGEYLYTIVLLAIVLGLFLLPIDLLIAYRPGWRPMLLAIGGAAMVAMILYRWLRAVVVGMGEGTPAGYILLYLCALEILPVAIALRSLQQALPPDVRPH